MRIGIDAMGSDQAPVAEVKGALEAQSLLSDGDKIVLVGVESAIRQHLEGVSGWEDKIEIHHTDQYIRMDDKPVESLRTKPNSSLALMTRLHAEGKVDACISAGNTGAFVAASMMGLRRLPGVQRPGIAIIAPTFHGPVVLCDVGANVNCRAQHLHQYGVMASIYSRAICKIESPRVALMSVGEEAAKGNDLVKKTRELLEAEPSVNFVG
ncbi:MAG: phosphate--acyl-ACP acyltransferase, partial [Planctomycetaceae bacterium]